MANKNTAVKNVQTEDTIDLFELTKAIWKKFWIIVIALIIGFTGGFLFTKTSIAPTYQASSMIYVYTKTTSVTSIADLQIGSVLTVDFQIIAETREVIEAVKADLGINDSYEYLKNKIKIENPENSRILVVTASDRDPQKAANLANSMANQLRMRIAEIMDTDPPSVVSRAVVPVYPVGPSATRNGMMLGMLFAAVVVAVIVIRFLLDDTLKSEEDIEKYLGLNVLASMPVVPALAKASNKK